MDKTQITFFDQFFAPLIQVIHTLSSLRSCPSLSDETWLVTGVMRALSFSRSGRHFLSRLACWKFADIARSLFFETLKSNRRLKLCYEANHEMRNNMASTCPDQLAEVPCIDDFEVFAGDGHWHSSATHDPEIGGKKQPVGHTFGLDLRRHALFHLQVCDQKKKKKEHDMSMLKRTDIDTLRQGAKKGRKVLWIWDKAGIDFQQWYRWKKGSSIYFLSLEKENMKLSCPRSYDWNREDPVNFGVLSDEEMDTCQGVSIRRVIYKDPIIGKTFSFITTLPKSIPPGVVAQLYRMRWDIEKVFDELKNKLLETKGWGTSATAKTMQAVFLCLAHNLSEIQSQILESEHGVRNVAEWKRKEKRIEQEKLIATGPIPELYLKLQRITQHSVKLLRWVDYHLWTDTSLEEALPTLRNFYATL